ncbi:MAG TPA: hypothetical protein VK447_16875 [Myxococcaceae bacterium]|nr:hypothetical protein [Myxococcaceae bacterium]
MKPTRAVWSLFLTGLAIGWIAGLSATPVIGTILASVLAIVAGIASSLAGIEAVSKESSEAPKPGRPTAAATAFPVALLSLGIAIAAPIGVSVRARDLLSPSPSELVARWNGLGLDKATVAMHFLKLLEPTGQEPDKKKGEKGKEEKGKEEEAPSGGRGGAHSRHTSMVWNGAVVNKCRLLLNDLPHYRAEDVRKALREMGQTYPGKIADLLKTDDETLRQAAIVICNHELEATENGAQQ